MIAPPAIPVSYPHRGYKMIESLEIKNFRCFEHIHLTDLKTVNLIVGRNASGKTALLEALYFTFGNPALTLKLKGWRGIAAPIQITDMAESRSAVWRDLFINFDRTQIITINIKGSSDVARNVKIACRGTDTQVASFKHGKAAIKSVPPIEFEYKIGVKTFKAEPIFMEGTVVFKNAPEPLEASFFSSAMPLDPQESAVHFSSLSRRGKHEPIVVAMHKMFPVISNLSIELNDKVPMVYATLSNADEKVPLGLLSAGVSKIFAYLVAIANQPKGFMLIDEIENGLHYELLPKAWELFYEFADLYGTQLFVSTHSLENLKAVLPIIETNENGFSLIRIEKDLSRPTVAKQFTGKKLKHALEQDIDPR